MPVERTCRGEHAGRPCVRPKSRARHRFPATRSRATAALVADAQPTNLARDWPSCRSDLCRRSGCPTRASRARTAPFARTWSAIARPEEPDPSTLITFGKPCPVSDLFGLAAQAARAPGSQTHGARTSGQRRADRSARPPDRCDRQRASGHVGRPSLRAAAATAPGVGWLVFDRLRPAISPAHKAGAIGFPGDPVRETDRRGLIPTRSQVPALRCSSRAERLRPPPLKRYGTRSAWVASVARRPRNRASPASSPKLSGTCSPATNPLLRQAPFV